MAVLVEKLFPMKSFKDKNGRRLTVEYHVTGLSGASPEAVALAAIVASGGGVSIPAQGSQIGSTGLYVTSISPVVFQDGTTAHVVVEAAETNATFTGTMRTPSILDVWIREGGDAEVFSRQVGVDLAGNPIKVKYQPPADAIDRTGNLQYDHLAPYQVRDHHTVRRYRRLITTDPESRVDICVNGISNSKMWLCAAGNYSVVNAQSGSLVWEERYMFMFSSRGWPEEASYWRDPKTGIVPGDIALPNENTPASIGTSANGIVRPDLYGVVDFESELGIEDLT